MPELGFAGASFLEIWALDLIWELAFLSNQIFVSNVWEFVGFCLKEHLMVSQLGNLSRKERIRPRSYARHLFDEMLVHEIWICNLIQSNLINFKQIWIWNLICLVIDWLSMHILIVWLTLVIVWLIVCVMFLDDNFLFLFGYVFRKK